MAQEADQPDRSSVIGGYTLGRKNFDVHGLRLWCISQNLSVFTLIYASKR